MTSTSSESGSSKKMLTRNMRRSANTQGQSGASASASEPQRPKVSSACDGCKRRKVRCTGMQPCERCVSNGISCTYGSVAGRTSSVTYTRHLEEKIAELQALLSRNRPVTEEEEESIEIERSQERLNDEFIDTLAGPEDDFIFRAAATGQFSYHGRLAGLNVLRLVRDLCNIAAGAPEPPPDSTGDALAKAFDDPMLDLPIDDGKASHTLLPPLSRVEKLMAVALDRALNCKECVDREDLKRKTQNLYIKDPEDYTIEDRGLLALVYALLALGRRNEPLDTEDTFSIDSEKLVLRGAAYFRASRALLDTSSNHDLNAVRTIIVLACYLLGMPMISKAYAYVCTGIGMALRLGLHTSSSSSSLRTVFSPKELYERKQVFAVLNLMDTYLSSILGMPKALRDADQEQTIPLPEDEMHDDGVSFVQQNPVSPASESIFAAKLFQIQARMIQKYNPSNRFPAGENGKYEEEYQDIANRESELQDWHRQLPEMSPTTVDDRVLRTQLLLRLYYACVRVALYRPFLHHVIRSKRNPNFNYRGYTCGSACIESSMQAVWLVDTFERHGYLHEAQWYVIYILTLSATSLMLFVLGTKDGPTVEESRLAAFRALELLRQLGARNMTARQCYASLAALPIAFFQEQQMEQGGADAVATAAASGVSPRTQFMLGIGAVPPEEVLVARGDRPE